MIVFLSGSFDNVYLGQGNNNFTTWQTQPRYGQTTLPQVRSFISASVLSGVLKMGLWLFAVDKEPSTLSRLDTTQSRTLCMRINAWRSDACYGQSRSFRISWCRPPQASCTRLLTASRQPAKRPLNRRGFEIKGGKSEVVQDINCSSPLFPHRELAFSEVVESILPTSHLSPLNKGGYNLLDSSPRVLADRINP